MYEYIRDISIILPKMLLLRQAMPNLFQIQATFDIDMFPNWKMYMVHSIFLDLVVSTSKYALKNNNIISNFYQNVA